SKFREQGDLSGEADALASVGDTFSWLTEFTTASVQYKKALAIYKSQHNNLQQIRLLASLIEAVARQGPAGSVVELTQYLQEALQLKESSEAKVKKEIELFWQTRNKTR